MPETQEPTHRQATLRDPTALDGLAVHDLIDRCKPLDPNSIYCNLLQCHHFAGTCVVAEQDGNVVGFISAYIPPRQPDTLFVWQIAVDSTARGQGLGKRLLKAALARPACAEVSFVECSITDDNDASWGVFLSLARELNADDQRLPLFDSEKHFGGRHGSETLLRIGPFQNRFQNSPA